MPLLFHAAYVQAREVYSYVDADVIFDVVQTGTPVNPGNALKRYIRAANALGIQLGGWHGFRHTLTTTLRRAQVHPKVISGILGHTRVNLAMDA
jgi:integrase